MDNKLLKKLLIGLLVATVIFYGALFSLAWYFSNELMSLAEEYESPDVVVTEITEDREEVEVQEVSEVEEALRDRIVELEAEVIWLKNKINILEENN